MNASQLSLPLPTFNGNWRSLVAEEELNALEKKRQRVRENGRRWREKNPERVKFFSRRYYLNNKEKAAALNRAWSLKNRAKNVEKSKRYNLRHPEKVKARRKKYYETHKEYYRIKGQLYAKNNPEKRRERERNWRVNNRERSRNTKRAWNLKNRDKILARRDERYKTEIGFRMRKVLSSRITTALRRRRVSNKPLSTLNFLGCSVIELKAHLESLFSEGMNWGNYGWHGWHIDHKVPCASFDLSNEEQLKQCFHYTNLQPLWKEDNQRKSHSLVWPRI